MTEIITEAIVLDKEDLGEQDSRVFLYTKNFGKLAAKVTSVRKIASKLAAHIQPLNHITVRLISRNDIFDWRFQLTDALVIDKLPNLDYGQLRQAISVFNLVSAVVPNGIPDSELWDFLLQFTLGSDLVLRDAFRFLGLDPVFATCALCNKSEPEYFYPKSIFFICRFCSLNSSESKNQFIKV